MGGWQVDVAGHTVGVAGEAGGWGGEKWLGGAGGDGWGRWRVGGEEWRGGGGREMAGRVFSFFSPCAMNGTVVVVQRMINEHIIRLYTRVWNNFTALR